MAKRNSGGSIGRWIDMRADPKGCAKKQPIPHGNSKPGGTKPRKPQAKRGTKNGE